MVSYRSASFFTVSGGPDLNTGCSAANSVSCLRSAEVFVSSQKLAHA